MREVMGKVLWSRICRVCGIEKELGNFASSGYVRNDGTASPKSVCKECDNIMF